jgi:hypothetical protein
MKFVRKHGDARITFESGHSGQSPTRPPRPR